MVYLPRFHPISVKGKITINKLQAIIKEHNLTDIDTIMMHQTDHDELALEYRKIYKERKPDPYLIMGVLIHEDRIETTQRGAIVIARNYTESFRG